MNKLIDISNMLTDKAFKGLKKKQVLRFQQEGSPIDLKIVRLDRARKKCFALQIDLYKPEDIAIVNKGESFDDK